MFSLIASVLFRPSAAVSKSVNAVKASVTDFDPRKIVGMIFSCARAFCVRACVPVLCSHLFEYLFVCLLNWSLISKFQAFSSGVKCALSATELVWGHRIRMVVFFLCSCCAASTI